MKDEIKGNKICYKKQPYRNKKEMCFSRRAWTPYTTSGDILNQDIISNRKQENCARLWAYNKLIGLMGIINAYKRGCCNRYEMAEYLDVDEQFLADALERYSLKYGKYITVDNYIIYFDPLGVLELNA